MCTYNEEAIFLAWDIQIDCDGWNWLTIDVNDNGSTLISWSDLIWVMMGLWTVRLINDNVAVWGVLLVLGERDGLFTQVAADIADVGGGRSDWCTWCLRCAW